MESIVSVSRGITESVLPPQDLDAERAAIGAMLFASPSLHEAVGLMGDGEAFAVPQHRQIFKVVSRLLEAGKPLDLVLFMHEAEAAGIEGSREGLQEYVTILSESFADTANLLHYCELVLACWQRRRLIQLGRKLANDAHDMTLETVGFATDAVKKIQSILENEKEESAVQCYEAIRRSATGESFGPLRVPTGMPAFDWRAGGLERPGLIILAARPSVGKTALSLEIAHAASRSGISTLFFSAEMSTAALASRMVSVVTGHSGSWLNDPNVPNEQKRQACAQAEAELSQVSLSIVDDLRNTKHMCSLAKTRVQRDGVGLIVVDYLQRCTPGVTLGGRNDNRNIEVGKMSDDLKSLAQDTGAAVLVCSQLSRDPVKGGRMPGLADLRDSGSIEQDADMVLIMHPDDRTKYEPWKRIDVRVAKNRNGPIFDFPIEFNGATMRFRMGQGEMGPETNE